MLTGIQYLRAVAALLVLVDHLTFYLPSGGYRFWAGGAGVDIFFVISGTIMWWVARDMAPLAFAWRRIARIVPLYWLVLAFVAVLWPGGGIDPWLDFPLPDVVRSVLFVPFANSARGGAVQPVLGVGWTLNLEMFFYAAFALSLLAPKGRMVLCLGLLAVAPALVHLGGVTAVTVAFYAQPRVAEFAAGMLLAAAAAKPGGLDRPGLGLAALILSVGLFVFAETARLPDGMQGICRGLAATLIVAAALALETRLRRARMTWLLRLGDASYAIYLTHTVTQAYCAWALARTGLTWLPPVVALPLGFAVSVWVALAVHDRIERPILRRIGKRQRMPSLR
jgi:exopolysaccharide production protein ExoZ